MPPPEELCAYWASEMFSVVIPIYNHARFLDEVVRSALRSPLVSEVLLLDDGSTDSSARTAAYLATTDRRVRNLTPPGGQNRGAHYRLNELVDAARCDWIAVLNSDDFFVAGRFERMVADTSFARSDFVFGNILLMNEQGRLIGAKRGPFDTRTPFPASFDVAAMVNSGQLLELLSHQNFLGSTSNMVFSKKLHARVGGFYSYRYVHDWDFGIRAIAVGRPFYFQRFITTYRLHAGNTIAENTAKVNMESKDLLDRFVHDFPGISSRDLFRAGMELNPNLAACKIAGVPTPP